MNESALLTKSLSSEKEIVFADFEVKSMQKNM
jgi:hypothetical protein